MRIAQWIALGLGRAVFGLAGFLARLAGAIVGVALLVIIAIEVSIEGGFRAAHLPQGNSARAREFVEDFRLDDNVFERLVHWVADAARGDFGLSTRASTPVTDLMLPRIPISLEIMLVATTVAIALAIPLGLAAARWAGRKRATVINAILGLSQSVPVFVTPLALIYFLAIRTGWFPAAGWTRLSDSVTGNVRALVLPVTALIFAELGPLARVIRADALVVLQQDYVQAAIAKGLSTREIMLRHVLRPASLGLLNIMALNIGSLFSGTVIIELTFGIGALGQLLLRAITDRDLYLLLGLTTYMVTVYVCLNTLVDVAMRRIDPRIDKRRFARWGRT